MSQTKTPQWLTHANQNISSVLRILSNRENRRSKARQLSSVQTLHGSQLPTVIATMEKEVKPSELEHYSIVSGVHKDVMPMNRYTDIIPYDRTRVIVKEKSSDLKDSEGTEQHDRYLNANWVLERYGHKYWIAAQAPLRNTAHAFMSLMLSSVWPPQTSSTQGNRIRTVVQLTQNVEGGRKKADAYFPSEVGESVIVRPEPKCYDPPLRVTLLAVKSHKDAHCVQSTVSVTPLPTNAQNPIEDEIIFNHMLYLSWPDHGVPEPEDRKSLLKFVKLVDRVNRDTAQCRVHTTSPGHSCAETDPDPPIMVNCSAGIGRTGSFLAISSLLRNYGFLPPAAHPATIPPTDASPLGPVPSDLKDDLILQEIDSLREQRPGMVQRSEQVLLVYELLADAFAEAT